MSKQAWVCITTNKDGRDVRAHVVEIQPQRPWVSDRWLVASTYTGSLAIAKAVAQQVKNLGPDADIAHAVAVMQG